MSVLFNNLIFNQMKINVLLFVFVLFFGLTTFAQSTEADSLMLQTIQELKAASSPVVPDLSSRFERLILVSTNDWLPLYYAAYCYTLQAFSLQDGAAKDNMLDKAQDYIDKAMALQPKESEVWVLQALVFQGRIMVNPMARGMSYSQKVYGALDSAEKLNANNPRIFYLRGQNLFNTPKMFGGGKDAAKPNLVRAKQLFDTQDVQNLLLPDWGKQDNERLLSNCK
jgi:hypothetical protein